MKKLYRSRTNRMIAGICGGIGEMLQVDPTVIRLLFVFVMIVTGVVPLILVYCIGWVIIPLQPDQVP